MYSLVFLSCALTLALAGYSNHHLQHHDYNDDYQYDNYNDDNQYNNHQEYNEHNKYHGPLHYPVIGPHGVPVEPHAVQAARAQHLAAHFKEFFHDRWIPHNTYENHHQYNNHQEYNEHNKYHGPLHIPVINHHGVPVEPHAVQAARAQHLAAHNKGHYTHISGGHHYRKRRALGYNGYAQHGVPAETPEVQAARAQHLAALAQASTHNSYDNYNNHNSHDNYDNYNDDNSHDNYNDDHQHNRQEYNEHNKYHGPIHIPVIGPHGVPVEPKEVQAARAHHLSAYSDASAHNSWNSHDEYNDGNQYNGHHQNNHQEYNEHNKYHGPIHIPVIGPHGVPVETPEVQAAKAQHLASHNKGSGWHQGAHNSPAQGYHHY